MPNLILKTRPTPVVSCDSLVLQGLSCEWAAGLLPLSHSLILVTGSSIWHLTAKNSLRVVASQEDCQHPETEPLCGQDTQQYNRTGSTQNRPPWFLGSLPQKVSASSVLIKESAEARLGGMIEQSLLKQISCLRPTKLLGILKSWQSSAQCFALCSIRNPI